MKKKQEKQHHTRGLMHYESVDEYTAYNLLLSLDSYTLLSSIRVFVFYIQMTALCAVFFDFDSTLSQPEYIQRFADWAIGDRMHVMNGMTEEEIVQNFGGMRRVQRIRDVLQSLHHRGTILFIISLGYRSAFLRHLEVLGLLPFFPLPNLYGREEIKRYGTKAALLQSLMHTNHWRKESCLFVDDSEKHIAQAISVCRTLRVAGNGLSDEEWEGIHHMEC